jgi:glycogen debranching enzyme GlgX
VLQLIMDSLRYWVQEMHVDGFRFDLAGAGARTARGRSLGAFFDILLQDPVLSQVKLIAEPWDLGEGGYQVGNFPVGWASGTTTTATPCARYWKGDGGLIGDFASRLTGSSDFYQHSGRKPYASINFVTAHDGFTLHDLVSYNDKHNEANGEDNRDGNDNNRSWNCGAEGPTDDAGDQRAARAAEAQPAGHAALLAGVPMLLAGDEMGVPRAATTTPTARTTRSAGSTGTNGSSPNCSTPIRREQCCGGIAMSRANRGPSASCYPTVAAISRISPSASADALAVRMCCCSKPKAGIF